jgi:hypothetical protein
MAIKYVQKPLMYNLGSIYYRVRINLHTMSLAQRQTINCTIRFFAALS